MTSTSQYVPEGLAQALKRKSARTVSREVLLKRLRDDGGTQEDEGDIERWGPFIPSAENIRRYGFRLPQSVVGLLELADRYMIEDVTTPSFKYLRVSPGGWEMPGEKPGEELAITVAHRFEEWNTSSNLQLWEHLAGVMSLGRDKADNRYVVATTRETAPVFLLDRETCTLHDGALVAPSLEMFLRAQFGDGEAGDLERQQRITNQPSAETSRSGPLTTWPPFLAARSGWLASCMMFGEPGDFWKSPDACAFDLATELPVIHKREPLALYWILRSFYLDEKDVFQEVKESASKASPLAASWARVCETRWNRAPSESMMIKVREKLRPEAARLRTPSWRKDRSKTEL